jgi:hypothetical protein
MIIRVHHKARQTQQDQEEECSNHGNVDGSERKLDNSRKFLKIGSQNIISIIQGGMCPRNVAGVFSRNENNSCRQKS